MRAILLILFVGLPFFVMVMGQIGKHFADLIIFLTPKHPTVTEK